MADKLQAPATSMQASDGESLDEVELWFNEWQQRMGMDPLRPWGTGALDLPPAHCCRRCPMSQPLPGEQPGSLANQERTLWWFCNQLYKDIQNLPKEFKKPLKTDRAPPGPPEHQDAIQKTLAGIRDHPQCKSCHFTPSRVSFRISNKDMILKEIRVVGLNKRQKPEGAQDPFEKVLSKALEFLESGVQEESSSARC